MSISVTGKLNEPAKEFANDKGVNFLVRIGVQEWDGKLKEKVWTNYSGFVFAGNENQVNFYRQSLVAGAIAELKGTGIIADVYGDQNKVTLKIVRASLGYIGQGMAPQQQAAPAAVPAPAYQQPAAPTPPPGHPPVAAPQQQQYAPAPQQAPAPLAAAPLEGVGATLDEIPF